LHNDTLRYTYGLACKGNKNQIMPLEKSYRFIYKKRMHGWIMDESAKKREEGREREREKEK